MSISLRVQGIRTSYRSREVVRGVSFSLREGKSLAIIGPNGSGKSTVLKAIAGFVNLDSGRILLQNHDISSLHPYERSHLGIGYLMQGGKTFPSLSVAENLSIAALALPRHERQRAIDKIAERFQLTGDLKKTVGILSGGQRQRLAIALVMVCRPGILLLDEPSAGLTPLLVQEIFRILDKYKQEHNVSILLVEQHLSAALDFADRVVVLVNGRITAETNDPQKVLSKEALDCLFRSDIEMLSLS